MFPITEETYQIGDQNTPLSEHSSDDRVQEPDERLKTTDAPSKYQHTEVHLL